MYKLHKQHKLLKVNKQHKVNKLVKLHFLHKKDLHFSFISVIIALALKTYAPLAQLVEQ